MCPYSQRRHRLQPFEVPVGIEDLRLLQHLQTKDDTLGAEISFRVFLRLTHYPHGRPAYPEPITWSLIEPYVRVDNGTDMEGGR